MEAHTHTHTDGIQARLFIKLRHAVFCLLSADADQCTEHNQVKGGGGTLVSLDMGDLVETGWTLRT